MINDISKFSKDLYLDEIEVKEIIRIMNILYLDISSRDTKKYLISY